MSDKLEVEQAINTLGGLRLINYRNVGKEIIAEVETIKKPVHCPTCGQIAEPKDRRTSTIRDLPIGERPLILLWRKRVWNCTNQECPQVTWTESANFVTSRHSLTNRAKLDLAREAEEDGASISQLAHKWNISWSTAMTAIKETKEFTKV